MIMCCADGFHPAEPKPQPSRSRAARVEGGVDNARRFLWIVEAALKRPQRQFIIDGEVLLLVFHGICDCDTLQSGKHDEEVRLYSFLRSAPSSARISKARCLKPTLRVARRSLGRYDHAER